MNRNQTLKFPFYLLIFAAYPSVSLLKTNFLQINSSQVIRPLIFSLLFSILVYFIFLKISKDKNKAGIFATGFCFIFLNIGHLYLYFAYNLPLTIPLGKYNYLVVLAIASITFYSLALLYKKFNFPDVLTITVIGIVLLVQPSYEIAREFWEEKEIYSPKHFDIKITHPASPLPDIYHLVLDSYAREDRLDAMGFDNSTFLEFLENNGFYIADCSRSNYSRTTLSLTSTLNMDYIWQVIPDQHPSTRNDALIYSALRNNIAHSVLQDMGYTLINNKNGYAWSEFDENADIFIQPKTRLLSAPYILPFETQFIEVSALRFLTDFHLLDSVQDGYFLHGEFYDQTNTALQALGEIPENPDPTLTYFHLIPPHYPYIFQPDGSITPPQNGVAGYLSSVEFINNALMPIITEILEKSESPPIIFIHADHGYVLDDEHRFDILNAIYFPDAYDQLYPTLSPVNTYRLIFKYGLGINLPILSDASIQADIGKPFRTRFAEIPPLPDFCP